MATVNGIIVEYLGHTKPLVRIISRGGPELYKTLPWPTDKLLTLDTIKTEVAKQWNVDHSQVVILDNVEIPKI